MGKQIFWGVSLVGSLIALFFFGKAAIRDRYDRPIAPGIIAHENLEHLLVEGPPVSKEVTVSSAEMGDLVKYVDKLELESDRASIDGALLAVLTVVISCVGFWQGKRGT